MARERDIAALAIEQILEVSHATVDVLAEIEDVLHAEQARRRGPLSERRREADGRLHADDRLDEPSGVAGGGVLDEMAIGLGDLSSRAGREHGSPAVWWPGSTLVVEHRPTD